MNLPGKRQLNQPSLVKVIVKNRQSSVDCGMELPDMTEEEKGELAKATRALSAGKSATGKPTKRPASSTLDAKWIGKTLELGQEKGSSKVG